MMRLTRRLLPLLILGLALEGCVAYPAGYGYGYAPGYYAPSVAVAAPCCFYGGGGYGGRYGGGGYGYRR